MRSRASSSSWKWLAERSRYTIGEGAPAELPSDGPFLAGDSFLLNKFILPACPRTVAAGDSSPECQNLGAVTKPSAAGGVKFT